ncbi:hypothetical protein BHM03_00030121 [Ensete ventricosum]|nr:hypothetical protein BHM03_00030121 [Ensete ventricosum]
MATIIDGKAIAQTIRNEIADEVRSLFQNYNKVSIRNPSRSLHGISIKGKRAVVVGRSNIVGLPVSLLLVKADATVTIVHSHTLNAESIIREADIVIAAAGQAKMIKGDWIKPGAAVIDVGTNAIDDPSRKSGYRLVGDVDFKEASKVAGCLTPVPGGVGPMTVAMLLRNTLDGAKRKIVQ